IPGNVVEQNTNQPELIPESLSSKWRDKTCKKCNKKEDDCMCIPTSSTEQIIFQDFLKCESSTPILTNAHDTKTETIRIANVGDVTSGKSSAPRVNIKVHFKNKEHVGYQDAEGNPAFSAAPIDPPKRRRGRPPTKHLTALAQNPQSSRNKSQHGSAGDQIQASVLKKKPKIRARSVADVPVDEPSCNFVDTIVNDSDNETKAVESVKDSQQQGKNSPAAQKETLAQVVPSDLSFEERMEKFPSMPCLDFDDENAGVSVISEDASTQMFVAKENLSTPEKPVSSCTEYEDERKKSAAKPQQCSPPEKKSPCPKIAEDSAVFKTAGPTALEKPALIPSKASTSDIRDFRMHKKRFASFPVPVKKAGAELVKIRPADRVMKISVKSNSETSSVPPPTVSDSISGTCQPAHEEKQLHFDTLSVHPGDLRSFETSDAVAGDVISTPGCADPEKVPHSTDPEKMHPSTKRGSNKSAKIFRRSATSSKKIASTKRPGRAVPSNESSAKKKRDIPVDVTTKHQKDDQFLITASRMKLEKPVRRSSPTKTVPFTKISCTSASKKILPRKQCVPTAAAEENNFSDASDSSGNSACELKSLYKCSTMREKQKMLRIREQQYYVRRSSCSVVNKKTRMYLSSGALRTYTKARNSSLSAEEGVSDSPAEELIIESVPTEEREEFDEILAAENNNVDDTVPEPSAEVEIMCEDTTFFDKHWSDASDSAVVSPDGDRVSHPEDKNTRSYRPDNDFLAEKSISLMVEKNIPDVTEQSRPSYERIMFVPSSSRLMRNSPMEIPDNVKRVETFQQMNKNSSSTIDAEVKLACTPLKTYSRSNKKHTVCEIRKTYAKESEQNKSCDDVSVSKEVSPPPKAEESVIIRETFKQDLTKIHESSSTDPDPSEKGAAEHPCAGAVEIQALLDCNEDISHSIPANDSSKIIERTSQNENNGEGAQFNPLTPMNKIVDLCVRNTVTKREKVEKGENHLSAAAETPHKIRPQELLNDTKANLLTLSAINHPTLASSKQNANLLGKKHLSVARAAGKSTPVASKMVPINSKALKVREKTSERKIGCPSSSKGQSSVTAIGMATSLEELEAMAKKRAASKIAHQKGKVFDKKPKGKVLVSMKMPLMKFDPEFSENRKKNPETTDKRIAKNGS
ncbi:unnamed protein product, partial [Notodromas monacha]